MIRADQRIEFIELVEVGPFDHTRIDFPKNTNKELAEVHIFTGGNGCGKTTLLHALASVFEHPHRSQILKRFRGVCSQLAYGKFSHRFLLGRDTVASSNYPIDYQEVLNRFDTVSDIRFFGTDTEWLAHWSPFNDRNDWHNFQYSILPLAYNGQRLQARGAGSLAIQEIQNSPLENHLGFGNAINPNLTAQWIANVLAKEAFALKDGDKLRAQQQRQALDQVIQAIREIAGDDRFNFQLNTTTLDVTIVWRGVEQSMDMLPDGLKSIASWLTDVLMRMDRLHWVEDRPVTDQPLILFLDEVDIHLHPKWQRKILPVIQKLFRNAQIFVSTHSPFVVGSVQDAWVYKLDTPGEATAKKSAHVSYVAEEKSTYHASTISPIPLKRVNAIPSGAGTSYEVLLEEVFEISEHYDIDSQKLLTQMKQERDLLLSQPGTSTQKFIDIASKLASRSEELDGIVALELRQLAKHGRRVVLDSPSSTD